MILNYVLMPLTTFLVYMTVKEGIALVRESLEKMQEKEERNEKQ